MKGEVRQQLDALERELADNEKAIKKLEARNSTIRNVFKALEVAVGKVTPTVRAPKTGSYGERVLEIMNHGKEQHVRSIARKFFDVIDPTQDQINSMANACSGLVNAGQLNRVARGEGAGHVEQSSESRRDRGAAADEALE